jgi:FHA domain
MADPADGARHPRPAAMPGRSRKRWGVAAGIAAGWVLLYLMTSSAVAATVVLLLLAVLGAVCVVALRSLGINASHPWVRQLASRPWRDGQEVLRLSLRHLPEVFVVTPSGSLLAPNVVELRMNPRDYGSLTDLMDPGLINTSAAEVYEEQAAARGARFATPGPAEVRLISDPSVPAGRYRLQQCRVRQEPPPRAPLPAQPPRLPLAGEAVLAAGASGGLAGGNGGAVAEGGPHLVPHRLGDPWPFAHDGQTRGAAARSATTAAVHDLPTVAEPRRPPVPLLRLVTGGHVAQTKSSPARAGRGAVELVLPEVATISREHARFTFADGQWWVTNLGRNGLTLNGVPLAGKHALYDGDSIQWGRSVDAPVSQVQIG